MLKHKKQWKSKILYYKYYHNFVYRIIKEGEFGYGPRTVNANQEEIMNQDIQSNNIGLVNNLDQNAEYNNKYDDIN